MPTTAEGPVRSYCGHLYHDHFNHRLHQDHHYQDHSGPKITPKPKPLHSTTCMPTSVGEVYPLQVYIYIYTCIHCTCTCAPYIKLASFKQPV